MKINKKIALQLPKQDFYLLKLCTVDEVHAVRPAAKIKMSDGHRSGRSTIIELASEVAEIL